jgi:hypothetical protein
MEALGFVADIVERRISRYVSKDFLGIIDVIALKEGEPPHFIQVTDHTHKSTRKAKMLESENLPLLLSVGKVVLHGWYQLKDKTWTPREEVLE